MATDRLLTTLESYLDTESQCERAWLTGHEKTAPCDQLVALEHELRDELARAKLHPRPAISRILVAVDHSPRAPWVLHAALRLAETLSASVRVLHVIDAALAVNNEYGIADTHLLTSLHADAERFLAVLTANEPLAGDALLLEGDPGQEIVSAAKSWKADLIVLAAPGHGQFVELLTNSATEYALRHAPCPVLTVTREVSRTAGVMAAGGEVEGGPKKRSDVD
jgi:universal stress protein A